jgi:pseudaminic acid synthase
MIKINNKIIFSEKKPPVLIAEISANHCGSKNLFLKHIKEAAKSGADMIKIQTYEPADITVNSSKKIFKIKNGIWKGKSYWDLYKNACTPFAWHKDAFRLAKKLKIVLFSTPFSERAVDFLESFKVPIYKISSFEITDYSLINKIASTRKPIILSTGMASIKEIINAIKIIKKYHNKIIILYCVSGYPTPEHEANVSTIPLLKNKLKTNLIGLSDHTSSINTSLASISFKVVAIEKHFKLSNKIKSEDSKFSIIPEEFKNLKKLSKVFFNCLGKPKKFIKKSEKQSLKFRRSIFSSKEIKINEKITKKNIVTLRPKIGINASNYYKILGKKAKLNIPKDRPIFKKNIS